MKYLHVKAMVKLENVEPEIYSHIFEENDHLKPTIYYKKKKKKFKDFEYGQRVEWVSIKSIKNIY